MFDSVGSALDTASSLLAGGESTPGAATTGTPEFTPGERLEAPVKGVTDGSTPNLPNVRDWPEIIEFIHFGFVHLSFTNVFVHPSYKDNEDLKDLPKGSRPRAIQFRSALEREAILMAGFMQSTQTVLQEREDDKGALGDVMNTLGSMTGLGGGGGSGVTGPADVNSLIERLKSTAATINITPIGYKEVHKAGRDYHQIRADYRALIKKIVEEKPAADPAGGLMGKIPGVGGSIGGPIGKIIAIAQGIAFKPMDIRVKFFARIAAQQEKAVEDACNAMTLASLTPAYTPLLPVWFPKDREKWEAPDSPIKKTDDKSNLLGGVQNKVAGAVEDVRQGAMGGVNSVKDFFEHPKTKAPGEPFLSQAFGTKPPDEKLHEPFPMELGALACKSFEEALGLTPPVVGFVESIIKVIVGISLDLTHGGMQAVLNRDPSSPILGKDLYESARHRMIQRLINLALDKVSFLKKAKDFELTAPMGIALKPGDLADKGLASLEKMVNDKIGSYMDIPLEYAMKTFADQLELSRQQGLKAEAHTMECYLGKLPWMQASLFCNIFFPFWDALMDIAVEVMGKALGGPIAAIQKAAKAAKGAADFGRDAKAKADAVQKKLEEDRDALAGEGINTSNIGSTKIGKGYGDAMDSKADKIEGPSIPEGKFQFPIEGRLKDGEGKEITKDEWESVKPDHKWKEKPPEQPDAAAGEEPAPAAPAEGGGMPAIPGL